MSTEARILLHDELDAGHYAIVFRHEDRDQRVTTHDEIDDAYSGDVTHRLILHRPRHLFVRPSVLGDRYRRTADGATIELDGTTIAVTDIEQLEGQDDDTVVVRLADEAPDAYTVATHPSMVASGEREPGVSVVHGFRFWGHIGWFSRIADSGPWMTEGAIEGFSSTDQQMVPNFDPGAMPNPDGSTPKIGLIDNGVDTDHVWMTNAIEGDHATNNPTDAHGDHGTMVAGILRQTAPMSKIVSKKVTLPERINQGIADEKHIVNAVKSFKNNVNFAVMAFGTEVLSTKSKLETTIDEYVAAGGKVFAAAGNIDPEGGEPRAIVKPAGFSAVVAVAAAGPDGFAPWSNGWDASWNSQDPDNTANDVAQTVTSPQRPDGWLFTSLGILRDENNKGVKGADGKPIPTFAKARGTSLVVAIVAGIAVGGADPFQAGKV